MKRTGVDGRSASSRAGVDGRSASSRAGVDGRSASSRAGVDGRSASSRAGAAPAGHTALLQAAREEFAERGYDGTSIRQIAQRAGMSLSVLYHYYPGKTELLQAIVDEAMDAYFGACEAALAEAGEDPVRRLAALVTATIRFRAAYPSKGSLIQGEEHAFNEEFRSHFRKRAALGTRMFSDVVEAGLASGAFRTPYPEDGRRAVIAMCNAVGEWYDPRGKLSVDEIAQRYVALALTVLECRPAARTRALRSA